MKRTRHTPDQIVRKLRKADRFLGEGVPLEEVLRQLSIINYSSSVISIGVLLLCSQKI